MSSVWLCMFFVLAALLTESLRCLFNVTNDLMQGCGDSCPVSLVLNATAWHYSGPSRAVCALGDAWAVFVLCLSRSSAAKGWMGQAVFLPWAGHTFWKWIEQCFLQGYEKLSSYLIAGVIVLFPNTESVNFICVQFHLISFICLYLGVWYLYPIRLFTYLMLGIRFIVWLNYSQKENKKPGLGF